MRRRRILVLGWVAVLSFSGSAAMADLASFQSLNYPQTGMGQGFVTRDVWGIFADVSVGAGDSIGGYRAFMRTTGGLWDDRSAVPEVGELAFTEEAFQWTDGVRIVALDSSAGSHFRVTHDDWAGGPGETGHGGNGRMSLWASLTGMAGLGDSRGDLANSTHDGSVDGTAVMGCGNAVNVHEAFIWDQINSVRNVHAAPVGKTDLNLTAW